MPVLRNFVKFKGKILLRSSLFGIFVGLGLQLLNTRVHEIDRFLIIIFRSSHQRCFIKIGVPKKIKNSQETPVSEFLFK